MDSLRTAFDAYLQLVASETEGLRAGSPSRGGLTVVLNRESRLREIVESLEEGAAFNELVRLTRSTCPDFSSDHARHFFRRSRTYSQCLGEPETDVGSHFAAFQAALKQEEMIVRYLAPLELVRFSRGHLDCGSFSIQHFSREELDGILQTAVNRVFYAAPDTERLCDYWFLVVEERQFVQDPSHVFYTAVDLERADHVFSSYQPAPAPIERALQVLSLFDWDCAKWSLRRGEGWGRFRLPFVVATNDARLRAPYRWWCGGTWAVAAPDSSRLAVSFPGRVEEDASSELENFSRDVGSILSHCMPVAREPEPDQKDHPWTFFEIAVTYLVRAFQTEGLDQLLWHMIAIEALVGGEPVRKTIRHRLQRMLASTTAGRKTIGKQFDALYDLRSDMVHGNYWGTAKSRAEDRYVGSLPGRTRVLGSLPAAKITDSRRLARKAILWFAHWLNHERRRVCPPDDPSLWPSREQLLSVLDFDKPYETLSRQCQQIENVVQALPLGFPNVSEWMK